MKVLNVHSRVINGNAKQVSALLSTLATDEDRIWPTNRWPPMVFTDGLHIGNPGCHGPIHYCVTKKQDRFIEFTFTAPKGFHGVHWLKVQPADGQHSKITHCIEMHTAGWATFKWLFAIKQLHNATHRRRF